MHQSMSMGRDAVETLVYSATDGPALTDAPSPPIVRYAKQHSVRVDAKAFTPAVVRYLGVPLPTSLIAAVPKRQLEYVAGRWCAMRALEQLGRAAPNGLPIGRDRMPVWPPGVVGSITHARGFVSAAVASAYNVRAIGIDTEEYFLPERIPAVMRIVLSDDERDNFPPEAELSPSQRLTLIFSAKESIFKCLFPVIGKYFDFGDVSIVHLAPTDGVFYFHVRRTLSPEFTAGYCGSGRYQVGRRYIHTAVELR